MMKKQLDEKKIEEILARAKKDKFDLSADEDLSLAIMNLVSIEEHMFFTFAKTGRGKYLQILNEARTMRKKLLKRIIKDYEGEVWCISKHLLAASMRLYEVGTKTLGAGKEKEAREFFQMAYQLYALFWGLNLGAITSKELKASLKDLGFSPHEFLDPKKEISPSGKNKSQDHFLGKLGAWVKKAVDCCIE